MRYRECALKPRSKHLNDELCLALGGTLLGGILCLSALGGRRSSLGERLLEVADDVIDVLGADGDANEIL